MTRFRSPLITYLLAEMLTLPAAWLAWWWFGSGKAYGWVYGLCSGLVFFAVLWLIADALRTRKYRARPLAIAAILALTFAHLTYKAIPSPQWYDWLLLTEGAMLFWAGTILAYTAPYNKPSAVSLILGWYWMLESLYNFSFIAGLPNWFNLNLWFPQLLQLTAFGLIFGLLRQHPSATQSLASRPAR